VAAACVVLMAAPAATAATPDAASRAMSGEERILELLAGSARTNEAKEADGPAKGLPRRRRSHCDYVRRYVRVAVAWDLPLTTADADAVRRVAAAC
jgi:hypothetical protein